MSNLPDAPWIQDAERNGIPSDAVLCPICRNECDTIYMDRDGNVFGCDCCICKRDAYEWQEDQGEGE